MYNKILAPLDGSKLSECALTHVKEIAAGCHVSKVVLLTVFESVFSPSIWWSNQTEIEERIANMRQHEIQAQQNAETYLSGVKSDLQKAGLEVDMVILKENASRREAEVIMKYAEDNDVDLIVMSTHGRSGPARWAMGSVADRISRYSQTPVLIITPPGCRIN